MQTLWDWSPLIAAIIAGLLAWWAQSWWRGWQRKFKWVERQLADARLEVKRIKPRPAIYLPNEPVAVVSSLPNTGYHGQVVWLSQTIGQPGMWAYDAVDEVWYRPQIAPQEGPVRYRRGQTFIKEGPAAGIPIPAVNIVAVLPPCGGAFAEIYFVSGFAPGVSGPRLYRWTPGHFDLI